MADACNGVDIGFIALGNAEEALLREFQGMKEMMTISSWAHMRFVPAMLGWQDPGAAFSAAMQLASLFAVISYFWSDVWSLAGGSLSAVARGRFSDPKFRLSLWIVLATVPLVAAGVALAPILNACNSPLRSIPAIGVACLVMAVL